MALFGSVAEHNANPPSTWVVERLPAQYKSGNVWRLKPRGADYVIESFPTKRAAEAARSGYWQRQYDEWSRWYVDHPTGRARRRTPHRRGVAGELARRRRAAKSQKRRPNGRFA